MVRVGATTWHSYVTSHSKDKVRVLVQKDEKLMFSLTSIFAPKYFICVFHIFLFFFENRRKIVGKMRKLNLFQNTFESTSRDYYLVKSVTVCIFPFCLISIFIEVVVLLYLLSASFFPCYHRKTTAS